MSVGDVSDLLRKDPEGTKRWMKEAIAKAGVAGPDGAKQAGEEEIPSSAGVS